MQVNKTIYPDLTVTDNVTFTKKLTEVTEYSKYIDKTIFYAGCSNKYLSRYDTDNIRRENGNIGMIHSISTAEALKQDIVMAVSDYTGGLYGFFGPVHEHGWHGADNTLINSFSFSQCYIDLDDIYINTISLEHANQNGSHAVYQNDTRQYHISEYLQLEEKPMIMSWSAITIRGVPNVNIYPLFCEKNEYANIYTPNAVSYRSALYMYQSDNAYNGVSDNDKYYGVPTNWGDQANTSLSFYNSYDSNIILSCNAVLGIPNDCEINTPVEAGETEYNYYIPADYDASDAPLPMLYYWSNWKTYYQHLYSWEFFLKMIASTGLRFKLDNIMYASEIDENGYTTGRYITVSELSDSDFANKEWNSSEDSIYDAEKQPDVEDDIDSISLNNLSGYGSAFTRYYIMTRDQLFALRDWINSDDREPGYDALDNIISLYEFPYDVSQICTTVGSSTIKIGSEIYGTTFSDPVAQLILSREKMIDAGFITVPARYGNYLDYEPYTTATVYIPYCGTVDIPLNYAAGKEIKAQIIADVLTGSCRGVITCGSVILATKAGQLGNEVVLTSDGVGRRHAALLSGLLATAGGIVGTAAAAASGNVTGSAAGGLAVLSGITKLEQAKNSSYSSHIGNASADVDYNLPASCYLLMTQPVSDIPSSYGHSEGFPCLRSEVFSSCEGYTVVSNADLSGISATAEELAEIKRFLEAGVIVQYE